MIQKGMMAFPNKSLTPPHTYIPRNLVATSATGVQKRQVYTEDEFLGKLYFESGPPSPIIIADCPGSGKSTLLAHVANKIVETRKDEKVLFVVIRELVDFINKTSSEPGDIQEVLIKHLAAGQHVQNSDALVQLITTTNSNNNLKLSVFLDGLDEVTVADLEVALGTLKLLQESFNNCARLWITTRPHLLRLLEKALLCPQVYKLEPWDTATQKEFIVGIWSRSLGSNSGGEDPLLKTNTVTKLAYFAEDILDSFKQTMSATERAYFGMPLLCQLIAQVFEQEAAVIRRSNTDVFEVNIPSSVAQLYSRFVLKFFKNGNDSAEVQSRVICSALRTTFPEWTTEFEKILECPTVKRDSEDYSHPVFIHSTIPDYFIARYIVDTMKENVTCDNLPFFYKFLWQILFSTEPISLILHGLNNKWDFSLRHSSATFKYASVCYFLDSMMESSVPVKFKFLSVLVPPTDNTNPRTNPHVAIQLRNLMSALAYNDHEQLFRWLLAWTTFKPYQPLVFDPSLVLTAVCRASLPLIKLVIMEYEQWNPNKALINLRYRQHHGSDIRNFKVTLLHVALWRGYRPGVMYLLDKKKFRDFVILDSTSSTRMLLHDCVVRSMEQEDCVIDEKMEIIKTLLIMDKAVLEERDKHNQTPLLGHQVHVRLLIELISMGAEVFAVNKRGDTVLHLASHYLSSEDYHRLVMAIPEEKIDALLKMRGKLKRTPLMEVVRHMDPLDITLEYFASHGAEFSAVDEGGESVTDAASKTGRSAECLKILTSYAKYETQNVKAGQKQRHCNVA